MVMKSKISALILCFMLLFAVSASAEENTDAANDNWQAILLGKGNDDVYYFDKTSLRYDVDKNGKVNKNIIVYKEKNVKHDPLSTENNYYSITECKINLTNDSLLLGTETFYKSTGEKRWSETPAYLVWYTVNPGTIGWSRYSAVAQYVQEHPEAVQSD